MIESSVSVSASAADGRPVRLLPSLDGLRAVSILLVILGHGVGTGKSQLDLHSPVLEKLFFSHSAIGVRTFFIISGFLITTLLLREKSNFGYISLPAFYTRRCLRILPAFFFYLLVIVVLDRTGFVQLPAGNLLYAVTYTMNFNPNPYWYTGHFWSLSVEEQFYLLWPLALTFLQPKWWIYIAVTAVFLPIAIGLVHTVTGFNAVNPVLIYAFPLVCGPIAMGCLLAMIWPKLNLGSAWFTHPAGLITIPILFFVDAIDVGILFKPVTVLGNMGLTFLVARFVANPSDAIGRFLNSRPMKAIGNISYSLYLWQQIFIGANEKIEFAFPWNLIGMTLAASFSYYLIERPFLTLKRHFERNPANRRRA